MTPEPPDHRILTDGGQPTITRHATPSGVVTREDDDGNEQDLLRVPISSTRVDREGDRFSEQALEGMRDQIQDQQPHVFDDHGGGLFGAGYSARETIGTQADADLEEADDGELELYAYVNPDGTHPEGERMLRQVRDEGQSLKFSVGFGVDGYQMREEVEEDYEGDGRVFLAADHMETSRVGIPANPDASMAATVKDGRVPNQSGPGGGPVVVTDRETLLAALDGNEGFTAKSESRTPEGKPKCESDDDCPDGEVCDDGHCVESDATDDPDEEDDAKAECPECGADVADDANYCPQCGEELGSPGDDEDSASVEELQREIDELRDELEKGVGSPESGMTDATPDSELPGGKDDEPDETNDSDSTDETNDDEPPAHQPATRTPPN